LLQSNGKMKQLSQLKMGVLYLVLTTTFFFSIKTVSYRLERRSNRSWQWSNSKGVEQYHSWKSKGMIIQEWHTFVCLVEIDIHSSSPTVNGNWGTHCLSTSWSYNFADSFKCYNWN
jgi:hypothetical protein